jgi:hypothetical protein
MRIVSAIFYLSLGLFLLGIGPEWLGLVAGVCALVIFVASFL